MEDSSSFVWGDDDSDGDVYRNYLVAQAKYESARAELHDLKLRNDKDNEMMNLLKEREEKLAKLKQQLDEQLELTEKALEKQEEHKLEILAKESTWKILDGQKEETSKIVENQEEGTTKIPTRWRRRVLICVLSLICLNSCFV